MAKGLNMQSMIMIAAFAILGIYLFAEFTSTDYKCTADDVADENYGCISEGQTVEHRYFKMPTYLCTSADASVQRYGCTSAGQEVEQLDIPALKIIDFIVVGLALMFVYGIVTKVAGRTMSKRDIAGLVVTGVIVYVLWIYVLDPMLGWQSLSEISWDVAAKLGLL